MRYVVFREETYAIHVDADSREEALEKANEVDRDKWDSVDSGVMDTAYPAKLAPKAKQG